MISESSLEILESVTLLCISILCIWNNYQTAKIINSIEDLQKIVTNNQLNIEQLQNKLGSIPAEKDHTELLEVIQRAEDSEYHLTKLVEDGDKILSKLDDLIRNGIGRSQ